MMKAIIVCLLLIIVAVSPAQAQLDNPPNRIRLERRDFMPEGIEFDAQGERFLLGSMAEGTVFAVTDDGTLTPFIEDAALIASIGLQVDEVNNRLLVVNAALSTLQQAEAAGVAGLGIYDLTTGMRLHYVDLGILAPEAKHFANDVAVDEDGNAYVTDSLAPVIYKVTPTGEASILLQDNGLLIDGFGGNGIVVHPDGYLLVGISGVELYKVPLDNPTAWTIVESPEVIAADGMLLHTDGTLIVVSEGSILALESKDDWISAGIVERIRNHPASTITFRGDAIYALHPQTYEIVRVQFP